MPKTVDEILAHADELSKRFEDYAPTDLELALAEALARVQRAVIERAEAELFIRDSVRNAREAGAAWSAIGTVLGTSGEAARQKFGKAAARAS